MKTDYIQFIFMPGKGMVDAIFVFWRLHKVYLTKQKKF